MWQRLKYRTELFFLRFLLSEKKGIFASVIHGILWLLSLPWQIIASARNWAYDQGWFSSYTPPISLVIGVGNITVGGTGKTPFTIFLSEALSSDFAIGVAVSGYRSKVYHSPYPVVVSKGDGPLQPASACGDEACMIAERLPGVWVFAGRDRRKSSQLAAKADRELLILDDGLQHRSLKKDLEVFVVPAGRPLGGGYFLPRGLLRDSPKSLKRARLIVISHPKDKAEFDKTIETIRPFTKAPCIGVTWGKRQFYELESKEPLGLDELKGKKVAIFSAIANPTAFESLIESEGASIAKKLILADHVPVSPETLQEFAQKAMDKGCVALICTEKDKVKLPHFLELGIPILWVKLQLSVVFGEEHWAAFLSNIRQEIFSMRPRRLLEWIENHPESQDIQKT